VQNVLGSIFKNIVPRGVHTGSNASSWSTIFANNLQDFPVWPLTAWLYEIDPENQLSMRAKFSRLKERGVVPLSEITNIVERSYVFRRLLTDTPASKQSFRTDSMQKRVAQAWNALEALPPGVLYPDDSPLSDDELGSAVAYSKRGLLINLNEMISISVCDADTQPSGPWDVDVKRMTIKDALAYGQPSMTVNRRHLTML